MLWQMKEDGYAESTVKAMLKADIAPTGAFFRNLNLLKINECHFAKIVLKITYFVSCEIC